MERLRVIGRRLVEQVRAAWVVRSRWTAVDAILAGLVVAGSLAVAGAMMGGAGKVDREQQLTRLIAAIEMVESSGGKNLYGDWRGDENENGKMDPAECDAWGWLQIHLVMVAECNRIAKLQKLEERFTSDDRLDRAKSQRMFRIYVSHHAAGASDKVIAQRWNGGPRGDEKPSTVAYWDKVKKHLDAGGAQ
jgi:hypothetical protein